MEHIFDSTDFILLNESNSQNQNIVEAFLKHGPIRMQDLTLHNPSEFVNVVQGAMRLFETKHPWEFKFIKYSRVLYLLDSRITKTMAVDEFGDLYINVEFIYSYLKMNSNYIMYILYHEAMHNILNHVERGKKYASKAGNKLTFRELNICADFEVNSQMVTDHVCTANDWDTLNGCYDKQFTSLTFEMIADRKNKIKISDTDLKWDAKNTGNDGQKPQEKTPKSPEYNKGYDNMTDAISRLLAKNKNDRTKTESQIKSIQTTTSNADEILSEIEKLISDTTMQFMTILNSTLFEEQQSNGDWIQGLVDGLKSGLNKLKVLDNSEKSGEEAAQEAEEAAQEAEKAAKEAEEKLKETEEKAKKQSENTESDGESGENTQQEDSEFNDKEKSEENSDEGTPDGSYDGAESDENSVSNEDIEKLKEAAEKAKEAAKEAREAAEKSKEAAENDDDDTARKESQKAKDAASKAKNNGANEKTSDGNSGEGIDNNSTESEGSVVDKTKNRNKQQSNAPIDPNETNITATMPLTDISGVEDMVGKIVQTSEIRQKLKDSLQASGYDTDEIERIYDDVLSTPRKTQSEMKSIRDEIIMNKPNSKLAELCNSVNIDSETGDEIWNELVKKFLEKNTTRRGSDKTLEDPKEIKWGNKRYMHIDDLIMPYHKKKSAAPQYINIFIDTSGSISAKLCIYFLGVIEYLCGKLDFSGLRLIPFSDTVADDHILSFTADELNEKEETKRFIEEFCYDCEKNCYGGGGNSTSFKCMAEHISYCDVEEPESVYLVMTDGGLFDDRNIIRFKPFSERVLFCIVDYDIKETLKSEGSYLSWCVNPKYDFLEKIYIELNDCVI